MNNMHGNCFQTKEKNDFMITTARFLFILLRLLWDFRTLFLQGMQNLKLLWITFRWHWILWRFIVMSNSIMQCAFMKKLTSMELFYCILRRRKITVQTVSYNTLRWISILSFRILSLFSFDSATSSLSLSLCLSLSLSLSISISISNFGLMLLFYLYVMNLILIQLPSFESIALSLDIDN